MDKKGWTEIIEAFVVILIIIAAVLIAINRVEQERTDFSTKIYGAEIAILRELQLNKTYRNDTLSVTELPSVWQEPSFPSSIKQRIIYRTPDYLTCVARICEVEDPCYLDAYPLQDTYAQSVVISSNLETYSPRQLKIFCWII